MTIQQISIRNILGIESLSFEPGKVTTIEGANASGKSSILEALKSVFKGGHDATLLRAGCLSGDVVLLLDDGTEIHKRISVNGSTLTATAPNGSRLSAPQRLVNNLIDTMFNPVSFLTADPRTRTALLLEAMPLTVTPEQIRSAVGNTLMVRDDECDGNALDVIARIRKQVYDERTAVNRDLKSKQESAAQLKQALPASLADPADVKSRLDTLTAERDELHRAHAAAQCRLVEQKTTAQDKARDTMQRQLDAAKAEYEAACAKIRASYDKTVCNLEKNLELSRAGLHAEYAPRIEALSQEIAGLAAALRDADRHAHTARLIKKLQADTSALAAQSADLSAALDRLDNLKNELLSSLPLKGVTVEDGEIYHRGIPYDRLNTAARVQLAVSIAKLRAGDLPLLLVDGLECLDAQTFDAFKRWAEKTDLQLIVTRVTEGALKVSSN